MEQVQSPPGSGTELPHQQRVAAEIAGGAAESDHEERDEQTGQLVEGRNERETDPEQHERAGQHAMAVEPVEHPSTGERADYVTEALADEEDADLADVRTGALAQIGQRWAEHAHRQPDD